MSLFIDVPCGFQAVALRTPTIPPAAHTNCYIIGHRDAVVVDPGSAFPAELDRLNRLLHRLRGEGGNIAAVLLTHHHHDHTGGAVATAQRFEAPLAAHPHTFHQLGETPKIACLELREGQRFEVDPGRWIEVIETPGHADGHLCLIDREQRALVAGDVVPGVGTTVIAPPEGDMAVYLRSLRRLASLAPSVVLPAHGPSRRDGQQVIEALIAHRLMRERRIIAALSSTPADLWALTRAAYNDVSPLLWPLASRATLAHLIKLEGEQRAQRVGECWAGSVGRDRL